MTRIKQFGLQLQDKKQQMHDLIKDLLRVWSTKKVQDKYQNYFLLYLDTLSQKEAEKAIIRQIKLTLENKCYYFLINSVMDRHQLIISKISQSLEEIKSIQHSSLIDMKHFSSLLGELRNCNLEVAELVLNFNYQCLVSGRHDIELIQGNNYLFEQLDRDNQVIKKSFLNQFMVFSNSYDPFFLYHYENSKKQEFKNKKSSVIDELFNLTISRAYKFMRTQQQILQFLSGKIPQKLQAGKKKRTYYQLIDNRNQYSKSDFHKLENSIYTKNKSAHHDFQDGILERSKTDQSHKNYIESIADRKPKIHHFDYNNLKLPRLDNIKTGSNYFQQLYHNKANTRKFSEQDSINKYSFKLKRLRRNQEKNSSYSPQSKQMNQYVSSINRNKKQQQDNDAEQRPLAQKLKYQFPPLNIHPVVMQPQPSPPIQTTNLKKSPPPWRLKAANLDIDDIFTFLKELNIKKSYRKLFQVNNWQQSLRKRQYYIHKHYASDTLQGVSLCCAVPQGDIAIKYWAPLQTCDQQLSHFLFKKYLQYIQKNTICKNIYLNSYQLPQMANNGFIKHKQRIYLRERTIPQQINSYSYFPSLVFNLSVIAVPKSYPKEILDQIMIATNKSAPFNDKQFIFFNYLLMANKIVNLVKGFSSFGTYSPNIKNFKEVQTKLLKAQMTQNPYNTSLSISPTNLLTIKLNSPLQSSNFIANNPLIKVVGEQIYSDEQSLIVSLNFFNSNTILYFGKGFSSIGSMITVMKNKKKSNQRIQYCLHMFSKRMRGRILSINLRDQYCFGDFQIIFQWKDFLKGKVQHNLKDYELFGDTNFYCLVQIQKDNILGFQVKSDNFL